MEIEKMISSMQEALSQHEELRGASVEVSMKSGHMPALHISFRVPEEEKQGAERLYVSTMQMLHDQMGLMQDHSIRAGAEIADIALLSTGMNEMARTMHRMSETLDARTRRMLRVMKETEARNDRRIGKWSEEHEAF